MFVPARVSASVRVCSRLCSQERRGRKKKQSERGYKRRDRVEVGLRRRGGGGEDEEC